MIDLDAWKQHKLTAKYQGWLEANYRRGFWPSGSHRVRAGPAIFSFEG